jgi:hypothetical protein
VPVSGNYGALEAESSGQYVTVSGSSTASAKPDMVQEPTDSSSASLWEPIEQSDGSFERKHSGPLITRRVVVRHSERVMRWGQARPVL